jgi:putative tricarboxylic transport membrane protein
MKKYDLYCALTLLLVSIFVSAMSLRFGLGNLGSPGPGFLPFLIGLLLGCISFFMIIMAYGGNHKGHALNDRPSFGRKVLPTLIILFAYAISMERLGYIIGTSFLLLYLFKVTGSRKWFTSILITLIVVSMTYLFFGVLLSAPLPKGILR